MQNLPRLWLVVTMLLAGIGWSVGAYLDGMRDPAGDLGTQSAAAPEASVSNRDASIPDERQSAVEQARLDRAHKTVVLSVDPTLSQAVSFSR